MFGIRSCWLYEFGPAIAQKYRHVEVGIYSREQGHKPLLTEPVDYYDDTSKCRIIVSYQPVSGSNTRLFLKCGYAGRPCYLIDTVIESSFERRRTQFLPSSDLLVEDTTTSIALCGYADGRLSKITEDRVNEKVLYIRFTGADGGPRQPKAYQKFIPPPNAETAIARAAREVARKANQ